MSDLEIFARVVTAGNMSAAGREMGLSPAVISKRISHLEKRLGARLIQRTTRQLHLTETGEGFYNRVINILNGIEEAEAFVSQRHTIAKGNLRVSAPIAFARKHISPYLCEFLERYPDIKLDINPTDRVLDIVKEGYDIAIRIGELEDSSLVAKKFAPANRVLCASPSYLKKVGEPKKVSDLTKHNCLSVTGEETWKLEGPDGPKNIRVKGNIRTNSGDIVRSAIVSGLGIAFHPTWDISEELKSGKLKILLKSYSGSKDTSVYAVYPCREFLPAKLQVFVDFFAQKYGKKPYWDEGLSVS